MKRLIHTMIVGWLLIGFVLPSFAGLTLAQGVTLAPEGVEGETVYAPFPVNITLDGEFDDWTGVPQVEVSQGVGQEAVFFSTAADADNLYIWADVVDDNIITGQHNTDFWNEDSLELYFNATGDLTLTSYTDGVAQLTLPPLNIDAAREDLVFAGLGSETVEAEVVTVATDNGWAVEVAVPLENSVWSITPASQAEIGFQVKLNTAEEDNRDGMLSWSINEPGDTSYQNPSVFGRLIFYEVSAEPEASGEYFFQSELTEDGLVDDFENGIWMQSKGDDVVIGLVPEGGAALSIRQALVDQDLALPNQDDDANNLLAVEYDATGGTYRHHFTDGLNPSTQDWSAYNAVGMWLYGDGSGRMVDVSVYGADDAAAVYSFADETDGWQYVTIPFELLKSDAAFDPAVVSGYEIGVAESDDIEAGTLYIDNVTLFTMENTSAALWSDAEPAYSFVIDDSIGWESREWTLLWSDEFEGPLNASISNESWTCEVGGHGWGNNELQYYTQENVVQDGDGNLVITAEEGQPENGERCWYGQCAYTSARCTTQDKVEFTYGRVEARIKIPRGQGIWPAFWMLGANFPELGWPASGELDIMEIIGREPNTLYGTVHGPGYSGASGIGGEIEKDEPFADDYHVFAVEWDPNIIRWYVDGELFNTVSVNDIGSREWAFDHDFFIITNIAIGGSWAGSPDTTTEFPQQSLIDYIRVYQLSEDAE